MSAEREGEPPPKRAREDANPKVSEVKTSSLTKETLIAELNNLYERMSRLLSSAKENFCKSPEQFVDDSVQELNSLIGHYYHVLCNTGVQRRAELDDQIGKFYSNEDVAETVDRLLDKETEWNEFLEDVDLKVNGEESADELTVGSSGPCDLTLTDVRTERKLTVGELLKTIGSSDLVMILLRHFA